MNKKEMLKNQPLISVIIPVYNVEKYINRCIDSLIQQTYKNLEIILINDGSQDISGEICEFYARKDKRIIVSHQKNQGVSVARNEGLNICSDDLVTFVDPDDYILPDMYEKMTEQLFDNDVDIVVCQWQYMDKEGHQLINPNKIDKNIFGVKKAEKFAEWLYRDIYERMTVCVVWNKLYKKCVFNNVRFFGKRSEDEMIHSKILSEDYSIFVMKDLFYVYCQNQESITNHPFNKDSLYFLDVLLERTKRFNNKFIVENTKVLYCESYVDYYYKAKKANIQMRDIKTFDKFLVSLFLSNIVTLKFFIRMILFRISPWLYKKYWV